MSRTRDEQRVCDDHNTAVRIYVHANELIIGGYYLSYIKKQSAGSSICWIILMRHKNTALQIHTSKVEQTHKTDGPR